MSLDNGTVPISFLHLDFVPKLLNKKNTSSNSVSIFYSLENVWILALHNHITNSQTTKYSYKLKYCSIIFH